VNQLIQKGEPNGEREPNVNQNNHYSSINRKTIVGNTNKEENNNGSQLYELEKRMKV